MQATADKKEILRQCVVTRASLPRQNLIRFVVAPDDMLVPDLKMKLPGRGVWVTASRTKVEKALESGCFQKSLRKKVHWREDLPHHIADLLYRQALSGLSIVNKAGQLVFGFAKISAGLEKNRFLAVYHARDASNDGCTKLDKKFLAMQSRVNTSECEPVNCYNSSEETKYLFFDSKELSTALGQENIKHIGLMESGAAQMFQTALNRYSQYINE